MRNISIYDAFIAGLGSIIKIISIENNIKNAGFIRNFHSYVLVRFGFLKSARLKLKDNSTIKFTRDRLYELMLKRNLFYLKRKYGTANAVKLGNFTKISFDSVAMLLSDLNQLGVIQENFIEEQYKVLNVKGRVVIDVGANIGDTVVYFSKLRGAYKVIGFEPYPYSYALAKRNMAINQIKNAIVLNQGVGGRNKTITIPKGFENTAGSGLKKFKNGEKIGIVTLRDIVKKYGVDKGILKMDCEGCEYKIILNSSTDTLRHFEQIVVECHYGYLNIEKKLKEAGFKVRHTRVYYSHNISVKAENMIMNLVFAELLN
ncbi:MAG: FkbM family methyltransferase [Candidatus Parvarchaeota archaeon]|nr:FkbM family methyltransferase [Candidatus Parvarchaeota archaeon]